MKKLIASVLALVCVGSVVTFTACNSNEGTLSESESNIVTESNDTTDFQLVKNLNTALSVEEVLNGKPQDVSEVIEICSENGYDVTKISLVTDGAILYWDSEENLILIWSEDTSSVIYPYSYDSVTSVSDTWYLLTDAE